MQSTIALTVFVLVFSIARVIRAKRRKKGSIDYG